jgi:hypothetical protein
MVREEGVPTRQLPGGTLEEQAFTEAFPHGNKTNFKEIGK